jgi:adenine/guanine phosphoribosyltransferase-like PRPP-binding protein
MRTPTKDGSHLIVPGDYLMTLKNCEGYYECPLDHDGKPLGPVVGYTADYKTEDGEEKKWVGLTYYNFAKADVWPAVLTEFGSAMAEKLRARNLVPDIIVGAPWAGIKFSLELAFLLGCRHIFAEKKGDELILGRYEGEIRPGETAAIGEELVNNARTTGKLRRLIEGEGGHVTSVACAINRSFPFKVTYWDPPEGDPIPIVGVIERETPQYKQNHPLVAHAIEKGNAVMKPKYEWDKMKAAMERYS